MAILFPRPSELRKAEWREFDLERAVWFIPALRAKMRREHAVPLPDSAIRILIELSAIQGGDGLLFPGIRSARQPLSEATMNSALRRLGFAKEEMCSHGFRAVASTMLNQSGRWKPDAIEAALSHKGGDEMRRAYNRSEHWAERVEMATWWASKIVAMRDGGDVLELMSRAPRWEAL